MFRQAAPASVNNKEATKQTNNHSQNFTGTDFDELLKAASLGNKKAMDEVLSHPKLWVLIENFCLRGVSNSDTAKDLRQEVISKALAHSDKFGVKEGINHNYKAWLFEIARNVVYTHLRKQKNTVDLTDDVDSRRPPRIVYAVREILPLLDHDQRELYQSYYERDETLAEIAQRMRVDTTTIQRRLKKVEKALVNLISALSPKM